VRDLEFKPQYHRLRDREREREREKFTKEMKWVVGWEQTPEGPKLQKEENIHSIR
jgi:hypothetical protein